MERGERERWNKLSDSAKGMARLMAKYADTGRVHLNDIRSDMKIHGLTSREIIMVWKELESRAYGNIDAEDEADPVFVMNTPSFQTLAQSRRLTNQAPHQVEPPFSQE